MVVAMFTGMRLNEIVSLTVGQIRKAAGVEFTDITEAETDAGIRHVPLHPRLGWLSKRAKAESVENCT
jgi:integrase